MTAPETTRAPTAEDLVAQNLPPELLTVVQKYPGLARTIITGTESHDGREQTLLRHIFALPDLETRVRGNPQAVLDAMDEFAAKQDFLINIGAHKAETFRRLIVDEWKARRGGRLPVYVEVGGYLGYSAIVAGVAMREIAGEKEAVGVQVWSIEMDPLFASMAMALVDLAGLRDVVRIVVGTAESLGVGPASSAAQSSTMQLDLVKTWEGQVDFLLLDHDEKLYVAELERFRAAGLLKQGSVVIADNVVRPGAPEYREMVRGLEDVASEGIRGLIQPGDLEDELEVTKVLNDL